MNHLTKVISVLNDIETINIVLAKAINIANEHSVQLEIIFVHEEPLFVMPDFFSTTGMVDKQKIKSEIEKQLGNLNFKDKCPIFVFMDDTVGRVTHLTKDDEDTLIITAYHEKISKMLVKKTHLPVLVVKNQVVDSYKKVVIPFDFSLLCEQSVTLAKLLFAKSELELVYDYRYLPSVEMIELDPMLYSSIYVDTDFNPNQIKIKKKDLKEYADKENVKGYFIVEELSLEEDLLNFINKNNFSLIVMASSNIDTIFSKSLSLNLLNNSSIDILLNFRT